jgi:hypothetical protein
MAIDEPSRLHLYEQARAALDEAAANTRMTAVPRDPDRFATKDDLAVLEANLRGEIASLRSEFRTANSELLRTMFFGMLAGNATLVGLAFAAARLA